MQLHVYLGIFHSQQNVSIPYQMFSCLQTAAYQISVVTTADCQMFSG